jgi:hypothetical protein
MVKFKRACGKFGASIRELVKQLGNRTREEKNSLPTPAGEKTPMRAAYAPGSSTAIL